MEDGHLHGEAEGHGELWHAPCGVPRERKRPHVPDEPLSGSKDQGAVAVDLLDIAEGLKQEIAAVSRLNESGGLAGISSSKSDAQARSRTRLSSLPVVARSVPFSPSTRTASAMADPGSGRW
jgi:hypothetical protein